MISMKEAYWAERRRAEKAEAELAAYKLVDAEGAEVCGDLKAEVADLREALEKIIGQHDPSVVTLRDIARDALAGEVSDD